MGDTEAPSPMARLVGGPIVTGQSGRFETERGGRDRVVVPRPVVCSVRGPRSRQTLARWRRRT